LREYYEIRPDAELSMESNPGTLTAAFLDTAVSAGVNRLSLGMQAYQPEILQFLGRFHSFEEVSRSVSMARAAGLNNLNLDLIFGIPGQTLSDWNETLDAALSLSPDHLSAYGLISEEGTPLQRRLDAGEAVLPDPDIEREMYDLAIRRLRAAGLEQYEISNFARKGFECRHNIGYWTQVPYLGLGLSAASMRIQEQTGLGLTCLRTTNPSDLAAYQEMIRSGIHSAAIRETISPEEARFETMMLSLRMNRGISESRFLALHGVSIDAVYGEKLEEMRKKGLMRHENGAWSLTRKGMDIQNAVLVEFM
jgi:oxygen-independent coproporphyrinogen-3 oxidase